MAVVVAVADSAAVSEDDFYAGAGAGAGASAVFFLCLCLVHKENVHTCFQERGMRANSPFHCKKKVDLLSLSCTPGYCLALHYRIL